MENKNNNLPPRPMPARPPARPMPSFPVQKEENKDENVVVDLAGQETLKENETSSLEDVKEENKKQKPKKEKSTKSKKEKKPKKETDEKTKKAKRKKAGIVAVVVIVCLLGLCVGGLFLYEHIVSGKKLKLDESACVSVEKFGKYMFLTTEKVEGAEKYLFSIKQTNQEEFVISSNKNIVDASLFFDEPTTFVFKVCVQGKDERSRSEYSKETYYNNMIKLDSPKISYNNETKNIEFKHIDHASSYDIVFVCNNNEEKINYVKSGNIARFNVGERTGLYTIYVVAKSSSTFYSNSNISNVLVVSLNS